MNLYKRQTRQVLRNLNPQICISDEPLNDWKDDDLIFHGLTEMKMQKNFSLEQGFVFTQERYVVLTKEEIDQIQEI